MHIDAPRDLEKVEWFQSRKINVWIIKYIDNKSWIGELTDLTQPYKQHVRKINFSQFFWNSTIKVG